MRALQGKMKTDNSQPCLRHITIPMRILAKLYNNLGYRHMEQHNLRSLLDSPVSATDQGLYLRHHKL
jgi:hypothetical protein